MGAGPPASKKAENISKSTSARCFAVLPEQIFVQARQSVKRILPYFKGFNAAWAKICPAKPIWVRPSSA